MYIVVGLGNPGEEYKDTRHNTGRMMVEYFAKTHKAVDFFFYKKKNAHITEVKVDKEKVSLVLPDTFMNKSGNAVKSLVTSVKKAESLVVVYDDLDLPIGKIKISYNRSSGGHRGLESIIRAIKTEAFTRIRVGISKGALGGKVKKPQGEEAVSDFIISKFKKAEADEMKKVAKKVSDAILMIVKDGREKAMGIFNSL